VPFPATTTFMTAAAGYGAGAGAGAGAGSPGTSPKISLSYESSSHQALAGTADSADITETATEADSASDARPLLVTVERMMP
jgi:hypothetical protein